MEQQNNARRILHTIAALENKLPINNNNNNNRTAGKIEQRLNRIPRLLGAQVCFGGFWGFFDRIYCLSQWHTCVILRCLAYVIPGVECGKHTHTNAPSRSSCSIHFSLRRRDERANTTRAGTKMGKRSGARFRCGVWTKKSRKPKHGDTSVS